MSSPDSTPDGSSTWWTRDPERSMNEHYEAARRKRDTWMTPARSPARLPRDRSPARFIPQSPVRIPHERSPTRMPHARSHARITSDLDYDIKSDDEDLEGVAAVAHDFKTYDDNDDEVYTESEEDPYVGGDQNSYGGGGNNDDGDEGASVRRERLSGSRVSSPVAEISPQLDPSGAVGGGGGDDSLGGGNNDYTNVEANVSGSMAASPIAELSPEVDPAGAFVGGGGDDLIYGGRNDDINKIDVCPICYEPWTCDGRHRTCCLPCGHIYGLSCIKNWLELAQGSGKCPQCKRACTRNDVRVLYATRLCAADEVNEAPTTHFPFTEDGFSAFQHYVFSRNEALEQRVDALEQRANAFDRRPEALEQRIHALEQQVEEMLP